MNVRFDAGWTDDEFDSFVRAEMTVMRDTTPVPALRSATVSRRLRLRLPWSAPPDRPHRLAPLAAALALAVMVAAGGGTWVATHRERGTGGVGPVGVPSAHPTAQPPAPTAPRPVSVSSTVRGGVPLIFYNATPQSGDPIVLDAVDWSGSARGQMVISGGRDLIPTQSPDGARLLVDGVVYGSDGRVVGRVGNDPWSGTTFASWADDGSRFCVLATYAVSNDGPIAGSLDEDMVDGTWRHVAQLPTLPMNQMNWNLITCSVRQDRAVLIEYGQDGVGISMLTIRLSSGAVLSHHDFPQNIGMIGQLSADQRYAVDMRGDQSGPHPGVLDIVTGQFTNRLPNTCWPIGLTPDATQVLCRSQAGTNPMTVSLVDWRTGLTTWSVNGYNSSTVSMLPEANGTRIAVDWSVAKPGGNGPVPTPMTIDILTPGAPVTRVHHVAVGSGSLISHQ
jgi:hypothetical protein